MSAKAARLSRDCEPLLDFLESSAQQRSVAMVTVSFHLACVVTLSLSLVCGIGACSTKGWRGGGLFDLGSAASETVVKAASVLGATFTGLALLLEVLLMASNTFRQSRPVKILCFAGCTAAAASLLIAIILFGVNHSAGGFSVWLLAGSAAFAIEALGFYVVQWRCA
ncbi:hypothetical protein BOX15_Mlig003696g2 [Macrostomum lignano]|uniref:MARVEL domain-containing protein n=1 Tax=Macrostomum lignano TaxID=282301 RepID=A0A267FCD3_9PLAT|nr:hypothetical protein BOX15_Mlig003696g2 [Macrostomum lignano]